MTERTLIYCTEQENQYSNIVVKRIIIIQSGLLFVENKVDIKIKKHDLFQCDKHLFI